MTLISVTKKKAAETRTVIVSFKDKLAACSWELLAGTPTATEQITADLTISGVAVNTLERKIDGQRIPTGTAVEFTVSGGTARTDYTIRLTVSTDASPTQTLIEDVRLKVI
jgi:hypothetical protein